MLGVSSSDSIDSAQFTYTISRVEGSDAVNASVPVGRIRCIQLVAASDPVDTRKTNDCILNGEGEVPRNAEYFGYSDILKSRQDVLDYGGRRLRRVLQYFLAWHCFFGWGRYRRHNFISLELLVTVLTAFCVKRIIGSRSVEVALRSGMPAEFERVP